MLDIICVVIQHLRQRRLGGRFKSLFLTLLLFTAATSFVIIFARLVSSCYRVGRVVGTQQFVVSFLRAILAGKTGLVRATLALNSKLSRGEAGCAELVAPNNIPALRH